MSDEKSTPIADSFTGIPIPTDIEPNSVTLAGQVKQNGDAGVTLDADVDIGKPGGVDVGAQVSWWRSTGAAAMAWLRWRGKSK